MLGGARDERHFEDWQQLFGRNVPPQFEHSARSAALRGRELPLC